MCNHSNTKTVREGPYQGTIPGAEENRAAHGWMQVTERCRDCGQERYCNINGMHEENGPWGDPEVDQ